MSKILVVYWSGTGNTEAMAKAVAAGAGAEAELFEVGAVSADKAAGYERIAFGCPSMGDEVLEEGDMEPFFGDVESKLEGKKVALFGSYDWGDGQWMRDWAQRVKAAGASLYGGEGLICRLEPTDDALEDCKRLGAGLAAM